MTSFTGPQGTINYNYDQATQLTGVTGAQTGTYTYDTNGNRTMTGYVTGPNNELLSDGTFTYTYNKNGQLATKTDASGNVWAYAWDNRGRLAEVTKTDSGGTTVMDENLLYDVNDNLIGTTVNGTAQGWSVWDGVNPYLALDGAGNVTERYITDPRTANAFFGQVSSAGDVEFYLTDQANSVLMILDASGNVLDQVDYDAYGNIVSQTNAGEASTYLFQGGALDANLGLYHFGARWYDPNSGTWISQDPTGFAAQDSNLYRFAFNSPTNESDASGLDVFDCLCDIVGVDNVLGWDNALGDRQTGWFAQGSNGAAGWGDSLSFGATSGIRGLAGYDDVVDYGSGAYFGGQIVGTVHGSLMMGTNLGTNALRQGGGRVGIRRLFWDNRTWGSVRRTWSGRPASLQSQGLSLHHAIIPQRCRLIPQGLRNAGFNYMPMNAWRNSVLLNRFGMENIYRMGYVTQFSPLVNPIMGRGPGAYLPE